MIRRRSSCTGISLATLLVMAVGAPAAAAEGWDAVRSLDAQGRTREALTELEAELAGGAGDVEGQLLKGVLLAKLGRTDEARTLFQDLIRDHPEQPEAYNNLAVMYAAAGDLDSAIEILKQGLGTHATYRTTYENLSRVYGKLASEAYSEALGEERIAAEPLRLALINELAELPAAAGLPLPVPAEPVVPAEPLVPAPQPSPAERPAEPESTAAPEASPAPEPGPAAEVAQREDQAGEVWQAVEAWAAAWAGQQSDRYLSFYAPEFQPPGGLARAGWESQRRQRLSAPAYIRISLELLEVEETSAGRAVARFVQSYESDRFSDTVTKALELALGPGGWQIVRETVEEAAD